MPSRFQDTIGGKTPGWRSARSNYLGAHGDDQLATVTVKQMFRGMRGVPSRLSYTSRVTPAGLTYIGLPIDQVINNNPKEYLVERIFLAFLFGAMPSEEQLEYLVERLHSQTNQGIPPEVYELVTLLQENDPMDIFCCVIQALNSSSVGQGVKGTGQRTSDRWRPALEDAIALLAKLPRIVGLIYNVIRGKGSASIRKHYWSDGDLGTACARYLGMDEKRSGEFMSLFWVLHACHETGPASTNSAMIAGNAWSTLYRSLVTGINSLSGDRHGGANDKALSQLQSVYDCCGTDRDAVTAFYKRALADDGVAYGVGHPVYEAVDPRFTILLSYMQQAAPDNPMLKLIEVVAETVPPLLTKTPKRFPNIDLVSGTAMSINGMRKHSMLPVFFAMSRSVGIMANIILSLVFEDSLDRPSTPYWDRATGTLVIV